MTSLTDIAQDWGLRNAHDPTVVRGEDGTWYMFSTDAADGVDEIPTGVHVRTSADLVEWTFAGTALDGVPAPAGQWSGASGLWAPEVLRWPVGADAERWRMYYSASTFGSRTSAIGLAVAPSPSGPWTDRGIVVATHDERDGHNAIDAAIVRDRDELPWLIYGSFWGGIQAVRLDPDTGLVPAGEPVRTIARRPQSVDGAIEGAYVLRRDGEYVLFCSYDSLVDTYSVRVGIADEVTGPYRDRLGRDLAAPGAEEAHLVGTKVLGGYRFTGGEGFIAPGHNSIFSDGDDTFMVHHVRFAEAPTSHAAQIRRVLWTASGWPVVSPLPFAGRERERFGSAASATGRWHIVRFDPDTAGVVESVEVDVVADIETAGDPVAATVTLRTAEGGLCLDAVVFGAWDPARQRTVLAISGIAPDGVVWSGFREVKP
ncbi:arabinan endo-1,5-alpha-L-arabinosidase [Microbacterium sp.]|uniref:arabinan endo-1,5-alpha-L-arabinosidase n=1 Tax=Microbacterium sp. TaxID=51671 RepID=UPI0039E535F5